MTWEMVKNLAKREGFNAGRNEGLEEGLEKGMEKGLAQGAREKARENASNLIKMNILSPEQIAQATGLSLEEVLALKEELTVKK